MTEADLVQGETEPVTTEQIAEQAYDRLGLDDYLTDFAGGNLDETEVEPVLAQFSANLAELSFREGNIDVDLVRAAFNRLTEGYNTAANRVYGPTPPPTVTRAIMEKLKIVPPKTTQYYKGLDDRYWNIQFIEQLQGESFVARQAEETDREYFERYLQACMKGFSWANFTYVRGG
ncbi:MAG TPA: hypothetical protein VFX79_03035 [Candidatus Saccharimonadales bacterium]|nr:hypothetical protein [Candidatus Saccharimonadales bacterium]